MELIVILGDEDRSELRCRSDANPLDSDVNGNETCWSRMVQPSFGILLDQRQPRLARIRTASQVI